MLSYLDESLLHQASVPFRMAGVTDHRFFDRMWYEVLEPSGQLALIGGLAFYKNMNQCDGFVCIQKDDMQHNLRVARFLKDDLSTTNGPLSVDVIEPFKRIRLKLDENEHGMAADLEWTSKFPPYAEGYHRTMAGRRVSTESTRYDQVGEWTGTIDVDGQHYEVERWWGARDHSWGVRPGVGGFEPAGIGRESLLFLWACFSTDEYVCQFQLHEDGEGNRQYFDGQLDYSLDDGRASLRAVDVEHEISFVDGTREFDHLTYRLTMDNGEVMVIEAEPLYRGWAYYGTGYDGGYLDALGLGAARGTVLEHDVYDLTHVKNVLLNGEPHPSGHRETPGRVTVNGKRAIGHMPVMAFGKIDKYNLG